MANNVNANEGIVMENSDPSLRSALTQLQIATTPVSSIAYGKFLVQIYAKANQCSAPNGNLQQRNNELFYFSPLSVLDVKSIKANINASKRQQHEVTFNIEMWNKEIQRKVEENLKEIISSNHCSKLTVHVLPYERAFLTSSLDIDDCWLNSERKLVGQQPEVITFSLACSSNERAEEVAQKMREKPEDFAGSFALHLHLSSMVTKKKQTLITVDLESKTGIASKLLQNQKYKNASEVLMSDDATKRILEDLSNISFQTYDEIGIAAGNDDRIFNPYEMLKEMLVVSRERIRRGDVAWDSVFWEDENSRPDLVCRKVNDMEENFSSEDWNKIASSFQSGKESDYKTNFKTSNRDMVDVQLETESAEDDDRKRVRYQDVAEKKDDQHKYAKETKTKGEVKANTKNDFNKVGERSDVSSHDVNQTKEDIHKSADGTKTKGEAKVTLGTGCFKSLDVSVSGGFSHDVNQTKEDIHKSAGDWKTKGEVKENTKVVSNEAGELSHRFDHDMKKKDKSSHLMEKRNKNLEDDASQHHNENKFKEAVKVDESDSYQDVNSRAGKEFESDSAQIDKVLKSLKNNKSHIEWDGRKYVPKSMDLNRINLCKIRNRQVFDELRIKASFVMTSILLPVNICPDDVGIGDMIMKDSNLRGMVHRGINCRECNGIITGFRYRCAVCEDYNLCGKCETAGRHPQHFFIRVSGALPNCFPALKQSVASLDEKIAFRPAMESDEHTTGGTGNVHTDVTCNECVNRRFDIRGFRYVCLMCDDYNLCHSCETGGKHQNHPMMRLSHISMYASLAALVPTVLGDMRKKVRRDY